jgi:hypothetical protein
MFIPRPHVAILALAIKWVSNAVDFFFAKTKPEPTKQKNISNVLVQTAKDPDARANSTVPAGL